MGQAHNGSHSSMDQMYAGQDNLPFLNNITINITSVFATDSAACLTTRQNLKQGRAENPLHNVSNMWARF